MAAQAPIQLMLRQRLPTFSNLMSRPISITPLFNVIPGAGRARFLSSFQQNPLLLRKSTTTCTLRIFGINHMQQVRKYVDQSVHNNLANLEQAANSNPSSASAQAAFYTALVRANMPQILVERFETGRYTSNSTCDAMYQRALERIAPAAAPDAQAITTAAAGQRGMSSDQAHTISRAVMANSRGATYATTPAGQNASGDSNSPVHVVVSEAWRTIIFKYIKFGVTFTFVAWIVLMLATFFIEQFGIRGAKAIEAVETAPEEQKARFADVQGCDEAKEELQEIVDFLRSPEKYNKLGGKMAKGVLMVGPPGTGKTLLARAVAGEAGVPFFYMSGSEFDEVYVGVGAKRIRELFTKAKAKAPAIVFIDELDAIGGKRNERDASYHAQTLNQMLTELDGFDQNTGVIFIAATNFPRLLDKALTRPGRFDKQVVVSLPDVRGRVDLLKFYMKKMQIATDVDATLIARSTPGFSGAEIEGMINQAAVHASKIGNSKIGMRDLEWAKDRVMLGAERKSMVIQEKDKLMTAYHESGHAICALYTPGAMPLYKITIMPRGQALGVTYSLPEMDEISHSKLQCLATLDRAMGGKIAEEIIYGTDSVTTGCSSDLESATSLAYEMVTSYGFSDVLGSVGYNEKTFQLLSGSTRQKIDEEVRRLLKDSEVRTRKLLTDKREALERLAQGLMKYETLNKEESEKVIRGEELPEKYSSLVTMPIKIPELPIPKLQGTGNGSEPGSGFPGTAAT